MPSESVASGARVVVVQRSDPLSTPLKACFPFRITTYPDSKSGVQSGGSDSKLSVGPLSVYMLWIDIYLSILSLTLIVAQAQGT